MRMVKEASAVPSATRSVEHYAGTFGSTWSPGTTPERFSIRCPVRLQHRGATQREITSPPLHTRAETAPST